MIRKLFVCLMVAFFVVAVGQADAQVFGDIVRKIKKEVEKNPGKQTTPQEKESPKTPTDNESVTFSNGVSKPKANRNQSERVIFSATPFAEGDTESK